VEPVKRQTKEEKRQQKEKEKAEKAAQKLAEKESALAAALAAGETPKNLKNLKNLKKSGGGGSGGGGGGGGLSGGGNKKKGKVDFMIDVPLEEDESLKMNGMEQQLEVDDLVNAVRTMRQNGYGPAPLAVPADARLFFLKRREFNVAAYEPLSQALTGW
jgi:SAGA-associated factor 73